MHRPIQSMTSFVFGVLLIAIGLAVVVDELTSLSFGATASVAGLAAGAVVLVAAVAAPKGKGASS